MAPEALGSREPSAHDLDLARLFHRLNNQLGVILANAELLERRLSEEQRARAEQVVSSALEAIDTAQRIRRLADGLANGPLSSK